jgi:hypothetical protein
MFVLCGVSTDKSKMKDIQEKEQVWMKYRVQENTKRNPGGSEIFRPRPNRPWDPPSLLSNGYRVSFPGLKRPGRGVNYPPHLVPRLKKE